MGLDAAAALPDADPRLVGVRNIAYAHTHRYPDDPARVRALVRDYNDNACDPPLEQSQVDSIVAQQFAHLRALRSAEISSDAPADILRQTIAPQFDYDDVPGPLARLARAWTEATGFDRSGIIVAGVVAAAGAIDDRYRIAVRPKSNWYESPRLWGVAIGDPSTGKSPTIRAATDPLKRLHTELFHQWQREREANPDEPAKPKPSIFTSDATTEALADVLKDNPRGVLMLTEEFASWIGGLDAYRDRGGGRDRGEWLQLYDGGPHQVDRVRRGSFLVPNWGASVLAACTPAGLRAQLKNLPEDGLIHRFLPCILRTPGDEQSGDASEALTAWNTQLRDIYHRTSCDTTGARLRFSFDAQGVFDAEAATLRKAIAALSDTAPALASHFGKHAGMLARVSLIFHVLDRRLGDSIQADTVELAIRFLRKVRRHANAMFGGILSISPSLDLARGIARALVADADRPEKIGRFWMSQHSSAFKRAEDGVRRAAVALLEDARWLTPETNSRPYGGWQASEWVVDARIFSLFAAEGVAHRERREIIKTALFGD